MSSHTLRLLALLEVVQQVGRVIGHHEWNSFEFIPFPPTITQSSPGVMTEESVGRRFAQSHHHLGRNDFDLGFEVREAKFISRTVGGLFP